MTIAQITVHASTSFDHPHESFSNFKPGVTLTATLGPEENHQDAVTTLQRYAHDLVAEEKTRILAHIEVEAGIAEEETAIKHLQNGEQASIRNIARRDAIIAVAWNGEPVEFGARPYTRRFESKEALEAVQLTASEERKDILEELKETQDAITTHTAKLAALREQLSALK